MDEKTCALINLISAASGKYGDKLIEYMNEYNLPALSQAMPETLEEFAINNGLLGREAARE